MRKLIRIKDFFLEQSSAKQVLAFTILILLIVLSFLRPLVFEDTIGLNLYSAMPLVFWLLLAYGLVVPFLTRWVNGPKALTLWGTIIYSILWSYFVIAEPRLRYPDSYVHSRSTLLVASQGINPSLERYLLWPSSFILQYITSFITGLSILAVSRMLAVILVAFVGLTLMNFFSAFFEERRNALLCLYATFIVPNTLMQTHQHYSPQLVAYLLALLTIGLVYKRAREQRSLSVVLVLLLLAIVLSHPTTTVWITPILIAIWVLKRSTGKQYTFHLSKFTLLLYLSAASAWWFQPSGLDITSTLFGSFWERFYDMLTVGRLTLSEGLFRPSYQPFYSFVIRRLTFVFVGVLLVPSLFQLLREMYKFVRAKISFLNKVDAFFIAVVAGSLASTIFYWIGAVGAFGDRTWGILTLVIAILCVKSIIMISRKTKMKISGMLLTTAILALIPLNFVATSYMESLNQTTSSEGAALSFVSVQNFHDQHVFSDSCYTLGRFSYVMPNSSNIIFWKSSHLLDPTVASNNTLLADIRWFWPPYERWTVYIHSEKTKLLMYAQFGANICNWKEFNIPGINKFYDNVELKLYQRQSIPIRVG